MYELNNIKGNTYYIESPAKIGLYKLNDNDVILIDSGNDKSAGRKIRQILDKENFNLIGIYNTHAHADHIGGNRYLQNQKNCKVYAPELENCVSNNPILEPLSLFGGNPPKDLKHKFLMAQQSDSSVLSKEALPEGFQIIELPGHSYKMVGYITPDNVAFIADTLTSKETIDKYQINFLFDVEEYLNSLEKVKAIEADYFVPSHAQVTEDITELADYNINKVHEIIDVLKELCTEGKTFDELLKALFDHYDLTLTVEQFALVGATIRSYLAYLRDKDELEIIIDDNKLIWKTKK